MKKVIGALALAATAASVPAVALDQGDLVVRAGITTVAPDVDSDAIPGLPVALPSGVDVNNDTQLGLTLTYMFQRQFGLGVLAATPFSHDIKLADNGVNVGKTKHLPPTVTVQWFPRGGQEGVQPYLGAGVNYTTFFSESTSGTFRSTLGTILGTNEAVAADLKLDDSWGLALEAGIDIPLNPHWSINAAVWWIDINTTAEVTLPTVGAQTSFDVELDPWVYNIGVSYRF